MKKKFFCECCEEVESDEEGKFCSECAEGICNVVGFLAEELKEQPDENGGGE